MRTIFRCCLSVAILIWLPSGSNHAFEINSDLVRKLKSPDLATTRQAIQSLAEAGPESASAVPALLRAMGVHDGALHNEISAALVKIGAPPKEAVPELVRLMHDEHGLVRFLTAGALRKIGPVDREIVESFLPGLGSQEAHERELAVEALGLLRAPDEIAVPALVRAMDDSDASVRLAAALAATRHLPAWQEEPGPALKKLLPSLVAATRDQDPQVRCRAATALGERGPAARTAVPALVEMLEKEELAWIHGYTALALGNIGPAAAPAVPALEKALRTGNPGERQRFVFALGRIQREKAVPMLIEMLQDPNLDVRRQAVSSLGEQGLAAAPALESLIALSDDPDKLLREEATRVLQRLRSALSRAADMPK